MPKRITKSKSIDVRFSEAEIKRNQSENDVTQLKDPRFPLRLRFSADRTKATWHLVTYRNNQTYWRKLGTWPTLTFKALENRLPDLLAQVAIEPDSKNLTAEQFKTVADLLSWYQKRSGLLTGLSKSRKANIKSVVKCHLIPAIGHINYEVLNPAQVDDLLVCPLQAKRKLSTVRLAFMVLKAAFNQAKKQKRININPMSDMVFSDFIQDTVTAKDGALTMMMLPNLLTQLTNQAIRIQILVSLLLAFGTRIGETRLARWDHFDYNKRTWTIPKDNTKTKQTHELPLTDQMIRLLNAYRKEQRYLGYQGLYLFPGQKAKSALAESTVSKLMKQFSLGEFSAHDFRKLAKSCWSELKVDYMVGKRLLNHSLSQLDKAYDQTLIAGPKREAIEDYHHYLDKQGFEVFHTDPLPRSFLISKQVKLSNQAA